MIYGLNTEKKTKKSNMTHIAFGQILKSQFTNLKVSTARTKDSYIYKSLGKVIQVLMSYHYDTSHNIFHKMFTHSRNQTIL